MNIHVANIARTVTADDLREAFTRFGTVVSATLVKDKFTPKFFGFVEMPNKDEALNAIRNLNGTELRGRKIRVTRAHDQPVATSSQQLTFSELQIQALFGHAAADDEVPPLCQHNVRHLSL
jgi:RNA recognition motif-containing protein